MGKLQCECTYCGHVWVESYNHYNLEWIKKDMRCPRCKDKRLKFREEANRDVFGYNVKDGIGTGEPRMHRLSAFHERELHEHDRGRVLEAGGGRPTVPPGDDADLLQWI